MSSLSKRFIFRLAGSQDNKYILDILEEEAFNGIISLKYTRRPDALASFKAEGEDIQLVVFQRFDYPRAQEVGVDTIGDSF